MKLSVQGDGEEAVGNAEIRSIVSYQHASSTGCFWFFLIVLMMYHHQMGSGNDQAHQMWHMATKCCEKDAGFNHRSLIQCHSFYFLLPAPINNCLMEVRLPRAGYKDLSRVRAILCIRVCIHCSRR